MDSSTKNYNSISFTNFLLEKTGIVVSPGIGFGEYGEGYIRFSLTTNEKQFIKAINKMKELNIRFN